MGKLSKLTAKIFEDTQLPLVVPMAGSSMYTCLYFIKNEKKTISISFTR